MKKKSLIMLLCAVLVVSSVAMGTIAYLTSSTSVTNTFTVGKVQIELDEAKVNPEGQPVDANGDVVDLSAAERNPEGVGNEYRMVPGKTYTKDPTVTVKAGSEESYIRMIVHITDWADVKKAFATDEVPIEDFPIEEFVKEVNLQDWKLVSKNPNAEGTMYDFEFRYREPVKTLEATVDKVLNPLFTGITLPSYLDAADLDKINDMQIIVEAQAIQTTTFTAEDEPYKSAATPEEAKQLAENAAWAAFNTQMSGN